MFRDNSELKELQSGEGWFWGTHLGGSRKCHSPKEVQQAAADLASRYSNYLIENGVSRDKAQKFAQKRVWHEVSHALKDRKLQSDGVSLAMWCPDPKLQPEGIGFCFNLGVKRTPDEMLEILLAPTNPSIPDIHMVAEAEIEIVRERLRKWFQKFQR